MGEHGWCIDKAVYVYNESYHRLLDDRGTPPTRIYETAPGEVGIVPGVINGANIEMAPLRCTGVGRLWESAWKHTGRLVAGAPWLAWRHGGKTPPIKWRRPPV